MASTAVSVGGQAGPAVPAGSRRFRPTLSTTPGRLRLLLIVGVLLSLAWGALAGFTATQYATAASSVVTTREPLSLDAQQIYSRLSDANDAAATAFLTGGLEPPAVRQRYLADVAAAASGIEQATANGGAAAGTAAQDLNTLAKDLPVYAGEVETARADNRLGLPLGAAYLREASALLRGTLLPAASDIYTNQSGLLTSASAQATGLPLMVVAIVIGLGIGYVLYRSWRWLTRRTHRRVNYGLLVAAVAGAISLVWLAGAFAVGRTELLSALQQG